MTACADAVAEEPSVSRGGELRGARGSGSVVARPRTSPAAD